MFFDKKQQKVISLFQKLGLKDVLCERCCLLDYKKPTDIQTKCIPLILKKKDVFGLAKTGSGKTAAFVLPILDMLLKEPSSFFACVVLPTRELSLQIEEQFRIFGQELGLLVCSLVGGVDFFTQKNFLLKQPHVIVCTPGRLVEHLSSTKGFSLFKTKILVFDEVDRLLDLNFEEQLKKIIQCSNRKRQTLMFSATITEKIEEIKKLSLFGYAFVKINNENLVSEYIIQEYSIVSPKDKNVCLVYYLNFYIGHKILVFCRTKKEVNKLVVLLEYLNFSVKGLHGDIEQRDRVLFLNSFRKGIVNILVSTDVASRGLDIPNIDFVINYNIPLLFAEYIHRIGRTARAGKTGRVISIVTTDVLENYKKIEEKTNEKINRKHISEEELDVIKGDVFLAEKKASSFIKEEEKKKRVTNFKKVNLNKN